MPEKIVSVIAASSSVSYQDLGRPGHRKLGIAPAGVMDLYSAQRANQLLGNLSQDTLIEIGPGGLEFEICSPTWLALAGCASCSLLPPGTARKMEAGELLKIGGSSDGLWSYLAAPGGWSAASAFGSHSFHSRSTLGPEIKVGDDLSCEQELCLPSVSGRYLPEESLPDFSLSRPLRLHPGPHISQFSLSDCQSLVSQAWQISPQSDRSGYRLRGKPLQGSGTIPSLPVLVGSLQIPPSGEPIVTLNDGPTVGGYPIIALIESQDLPYFVQHPPFSKISFTWYHEAPS